MPPQAPQIGQNLAAGREHLKAAETAISADDAEMASAHAAVAIGHILILVTAHLSQIRTLLLKSQED